MLTGRRYLLDLSAGQEVFAERIGGTVRAVWNTALEQRREYRRRGAFVCYAEQARQLADAKGEEELAWLGEAPGHCLQQTLIDLDDACGRHGTWKVRWKSKARTKPSFRFPEGGKIAVERLNRRWARVKLPKLGWVRFRRTRPLGGPIKNATIRQEGQRWYISFLVDDGIDTPDRHTRPDTGIGVDRGVAKIVTTSDGEFYHRVFATDREIGHAAKLQRDHSRTVKGSNRRRRAARRRGAFAARIRRREDFAAKTAHALARDHDLTVFEALSTTNRPPKSRPARTRTVRAPTCRTGRPPSPA